MKIRIILDGKLKESFYREGAFEYQKRLVGSKKNVEIVETDHLEDYIKKDSYVITLEIEGHSLSSVEFATKLRQIELEGCYNEIIFLIGGADGLNNEIRNKSNFRFSISKLTFLHQEAVLILIEQIYRAYKILNKEAYHR